MSQKPFIHLRAHTAYSLAEGAITIKELVKTCKQYNMPAVGVTDTANLFGALEFALAMSDSGIQPIVGCQLYIESSEDLPDILPVIVQTEQGYRNLLKIISQAYLKSLSQDLPVASWESLERYNQGLIALTGGVTWAAQAQKYIYFLSFSRYYPPTIAFLIREFHPLNAPLIQNPGYQKRATFAFASALFS